MEAIRAANFLTNNDDGGAEWIKFNKSPDDAAGGRGGRRRRRG
jgi:5-methyltetrahydrofolate--homocysteine methyltransferase